MEPDPKVTIGSGPRSETNTLFRIYNTGLHLMTTGISHAIPEDGTGTVRYGTVRVPYLDDVSVKEEGAELVLQ